MFRNRISPLGVIENVQQAIEHHDAEDGHDASADKARRRRAAFAHLRNGDSRSQDSAIDKVDVIGRERAPQSKLGDVVQIADEMVKGVSEACGGKSGDGDAQSFPSLEEIQKDGIEENIDEQFLEIKIVAVPEFGDGS